MISECVPHWFTPLSGTRYCGNGARAIYPVIDYLFNDEILQNLQCPGMTLNGNLMGPGNKAVSLGNRESKSKLNQTRTEVKITRSLREKVLRHQFSLKTPIWLSCPVGGVGYILSLWKHFQSVSVLWLSIRNTLYLVFTAPIAEPDFVMLD